MPISDSDPTQWQAWSVAIPTTLTAISTWYLSRKSSKTATTVKKSGAETAITIETAANTFKKAFGALGARVSALDAKVEELKSARVIDSQKYVEIANQLQVELAQTRAVLAKIVANKLTEANVNPVNKDEPITDKNFGKVIHKP